MECDSHSDSAVLDASAVVVGVFAADSADSAIGFGTATVECDADVWEALIIDK